MPPGASRSAGNFSRTERAGEQTVPPPRPGHSSYKPAIVLALLVAAFVLLQSLLPLGTTIQIGGDEGFALAKATLCLKGFKLYTEVWNDQPPLHTFLLTQILKHFTPSILGPRLLTSWCAVVLLATVFLSALRINGVVVAGLTTGLLIASPGFLELSSSCMVEVPALAPAIAALGLLLVLPRERLRLGQIVAGVLFGIALQTKFNTAVYLPLAGLILWSRQAGATSPLARLEPPSQGRTNGHEARRREPGPGGNPPSDGKVGKRNHEVTRSILLFAASVGVSFFAVSYLIGETAYALQFKQAWSAHVASAKSFEYGSPGDRPFDWTILLKNWDTTIPALVGIVLLLRRARRDISAIIPPVWLVVTLVVFATHRPWWSYYYVHNAVPLCWCAAIGLATVVQRVTPQRNAGGFALLVVYAICALPWMGSRLYLQVSDIRKSPQTYSSLVLTEIGRFKPFTQFIYADQRIYSFHSGIPIPPKLAVVSLKRLWSGDLTNEKIAAELWRIKPGVILLDNDSRALPFEDLLTTEYRLVYRDDEHRLYAQKAVIAQAKY